MKIKLKQKTRDNIEQTFTSQNIYNGIVTSFWFYSAFYLVQFGLIKISEGYGFYFDLNSLWSQTFVVSLIGSSVPFILEGIRELNYWLKSNYKNGVLEI